MPPKSVDGKAVHANAVAPYELDFALKSRDKHHNFSLSKGGVDHEAYAYQLALDMGSAPTFSFMMRKGFKMFYTWAMGSNFNPKFRLVGPWANEDEAEHIMKTELYDVVKRTGGLVCQYTLFQNLSLVFSFAVTTEANTNLMQSSLRTLLSLFSFSAFSVSLSTPRMESPTQPPVEPRRSANSFLSPGPVRMRRCTRIKIPHGF